MAGPTPPPLLRAARAGFQAAALVWLILAGASLRLAAAGGDPLRWTYTGLMGANALAFAWFGVTLRAARPRRLALASAYAFLNAVVCLADQVGTIDLLLLAFSLCLAAVALAARLRPGGAVAEGV